MASTSFVLVEWIGDKKPDCWQVIKKEQFLKPEDVEEGKTLDAYWKVGEESSPAKILKLHDTKSYLFSVKENEYFKPWKTSVSAKRVSSAPKTLDEYVTTEESTINACATNVKKNQLKNSASSKLSCKKQQVKKAKIQPSGCDSEGKTDNSTSVETDGDKEYSKSEMKSSKEEAEKVLAASLLKKSRQPSPVPLPNKQKQVSSDKSEEDDLESEDDIIEKAKAFGLPPVKKTKECCEHCHPLQKRLTEMECEVQKLKKKLRTLSKTSTGLEEKVGEPRGRIRKKL